MKIFLVTLKLPKNADHDPKNKIFGRCPADRYAYCDDITGEHHVVMHKTDDDRTLVQDVRAFYTLNFHVTRVEDITQSLRMEES